MSFSWKQPIYALIFQQSEPTQMLWSLCACHNVEYEIWGACRITIHLGLKNGTSDISAGSWNSLKAYLEDWWFVGNLYRKRPNNTGKWGYHNGVHLSPIGLNLEHYSGTESVLMRKRNKSVSLEHWTGCPIRKMFGSCRAFGQSCRTGFLNLSCT